MKQFLWVISNLLFISSCNSTPEKVVSHQAVVTATEAMFTETDSVFHFEIELAYPVIDANVNPEILNKINNTISEQFYVFSDQATFIESHHDLPEHFYADDYEWFGILQNSYTISQCDSTLNIGFSVYRYFLGAAHGFTANYSLQFNLITGDQLHYSDFFKSDSVSITKAKNIINNTLPDSICWGIEHDSITREILTNFTISNDSISFKVNDYTLCPYAYGFTYISLPKTAFKEILIAKEYDFCTDISPMQDEGEIATH